MDLKKRLILNFKITSEVRKREKLRAISPWKKVELQDFDARIKRLENQLKESSDA